MCDIQQLRAIHDLDHIKPALNPLAGPNRLYIAVNCPMITAPNPPILFAIGQDTSRLSLEVRWRLIGILVWADTRLRGLIAAAFAAAVLRPGGRHT